MAKKKNKNSERNAYVKVMMKRHHGNQVHSDKRNRRKKNPKNSWKKDWE